MPRPAFIYSPDYEMDIGRHVFPTSKFRLLREELARRVLVAPEEIELSPPATDEQLLSVLRVDYLTDLRRFHHSSSTVRSELPITPQIIDGCIRTAGGSILAVQRALERGGACHLGGGFHHGFADHAEGFCYINDVAVAAAWALACSWAQRVAIIDVDVHQGNGSARIFQNNPNVFTFSIHQENLYPLKEHGDLDIGLPDGIGDEGYLMELERGLEAVIDGFRPDLAIYVAGVDPYQGDVLGSLGLTFGGMRLRDEAVIGRLARERIPFVTVTAGGYAEALRDTVELHVQTVATAIHALAGRDGRPAAIGARQTA